MPSIASIPGIIIGTNNSTRRYKQTHPWLDFSPDLRNAPLQLWMLLGEACSKCEHISGIPLQPHVSESLHLIYLAKGAHATTAIEGNTLSEEEVAKRIRGIRDLPPSKEYLGKEVDNILTGCNEILNDLADGSIRPLTPARIKELNRIVLEGLDLEPGVFAGEIPTFDVGVPGYVGAPREDCDHLLAQLCEWLERLDASFEQLQNPRLSGAILKAILSHLYLVWIHPFGDGNGRTARLIEYQILAGSGLPSPAAHLLSNHYNETRSEYYRQLQRASREPSGAIGFIRYALEGFVDGLQTQIELIHYQQLDVTWENYVHDKFRNMNSATNTRRRHLVLDLSLGSSAVPLTNIREMNPRTAAAYANRTDKTLNRDITALEHMGLVRRTKDGILPCRELILAFLPIVGPSDPPSPTATDAHPQLPLS